MEGSLEGLLDPRPRAGRGGDNAAVVTCTSMASSNFTSAAVFDILRTATVLLIDCIPVHKIYFSLQLQPLLHMCVGCTIDAMRLQLWCVA